ncbi:MAG TPA: RsmD family RNA methyltransferase, partial [Actinomycetota bacterium]|nr:RsmD family RNA methyltransferase [Actinomycetota bacterium]
LSRGADRADFVDSSATAVKTVRENLRRTGLADRATVLRQDALRFILGDPGPFDVVFLDPPYATPPGVLDAVLEALHGTGVAAVGAVVVLTRSSRSYTPVIPLHWLADRRLSYGDAAVLVFRAGTAD